MLIYSWFCYIILRTLGNVLKKGHVKVSTKTQKELYPLYMLTPKFDANVIDNLPAGHSLTGCDTVAKVCTKIPVNSSKG